MKRTIIIMISLVALAGLATIVFVRQDKSVEPISPDPVSRIIDPKNATYRIDGEEVTLSNGESTVSMSGSSSMVVTRYFGNELIKDVNGDRREDAVFLLTQETGGSGTFYYVVAALNTATGYVGSEAYYLGDRIAPQTTEAGLGQQIIVNYAERAPEEPFSTPPSVGKSIRLLLDASTLQFGEVAVDFEGEADSARMTLGMKTWVWQRALYNDGKEVTPSKADVFTLTFAQDDSVEVGTDCNSVGSRYTTTEGSFSISELQSTRMFCDGSQEAYFIDLLTDAVTYHFTSKGELVLGLKNDSGSVVFR